MDDVVQLLAQFLTKQQTLNNAAKKVLKLEQEIVDALPRY